MQLQHSFTVPADVDTAWRTLMDIERVAPCMPGAVLEAVEGDHFRGSVKVKLGPIAITYRGTAHFVSRDAAAKSAVIEAAAKESRGNGTATATIRAQLSKSGAMTRVDVITDLNITGRPAQFGRGVMADVGDKIIGQFAESLAGEMARDVGASGGGQAAQERQAPAPGQHAPMAVDLFEVAGPAVVKRVVPAIGVALVLLVLARSVFRKTPAAR